MTCAEIKERTVDYLYGELPPGARATFEAHLGGCEGCRAEVAGLQGTLHQARAAVRTLDEAPPPRVRVAILEAARAAAGASAGAPLLAAAAPRRDGPKVQQGGGFWEWLRRPWFLSLVGATAAMAIFVMARGTLTKPSLMEQAPPAAPSPSAEPAPSGAEPAPVVKSAPADKDLAPPAANKPEAMKVAPAKRGSRPAMTAAPAASRGPARLQREYDKLDDLLDSPAANRGFATPPPPREETAPRAKAVSGDDALEGALGSGGRRDGQGLGGLGATGTSAGGGGLGQPGRAAEKKQAESRRAPADERSRQADRLEAPAAAAPAAAPPPARPRPGPARPAWGAV
jgi:anti-sigma factor RsiW